MTSDRTEAPGLLGLDRGVVPEGEEYGGLF